MSNICSSKSKYGRSSYVYENATWKQYQKVSDALLVISPAWDKNCPKPLTPQDAERALYPLVMKG